MKPKARQDLLVQELGDEVVLYDRERQRAHLLNRTATLVWHHCDGQTTVADMAERLQKELNLPADEKLVWLALDRLERAHLLLEHLPPPPHGGEISRREALQRLGRAGAAALLLPVVTSIIAPTPAMAQTGIEKEGSPRLRRPSHK